MPSINFNKQKKEVEWADLAVFVAGAQVAKLHGIKYKSKKEKELLMGEGDKPIGTQSGNRSYEGELKILKGAVDILNDAAIAANGDDLLDLVLDIVVTYKPVGTTRPVRIDTLVNVSFKDYEKGMEQGAMKMPITLPFIYEDQINA